MVISYRSSVIRNFDGVTQFLGIFTKSSQYVFFLFFLLITDNQLLSIAMAKDLGVHGTIAHIEETDPIALIHQKLKVMEDSGELERRNRELQKKTKVAVERPRSVVGITKATQSRIFYYNPAYVVKEDLKDHQGRIFASKGSKFNPLETVSLSQSLLFFDGDDLGQIKWVQEKLQKGQVKLILIQGAPLKLAEKLKLPVYFDQGGELTKKLGISHVPAVVSQENLHLRIEEVALSPSRESNIEGEL